MTLRVPEGWFHSMAYSTAVPALARAFHRLSKDAAVRRYAEHHSATMIGWRVGYAYIWPTPTGSLRPFGHSGHTPARYAYRETIRLALHPFTAVMYVVILFAVG